MFELLQDHVHECYEDDFEKIVKEIDLDHDGKIDYNEFLQAAVSH